MNAQNSNRISRPRSWATSTGPQTPLELDDRPQHQPGHQDILELSLGCFLCCLFGRNCAWVEGVQQPCSIQPGVWLWRGSAATGFCLWQAPSPSVPERKEGLWADSNRQKNPQSMHARARECHHARVRKLEKRACSLCLIHISDIHIYVGRTSLTQTMNPQELCTQTSSQPTCIPTHQDTVSCING